MNLHCEPNIDYQILAIEAGCDLFREQETCHTEFADSRDPMDPQVQAGIIDWYHTLAPAGDTTCVFRDSAFADDVAKTNMAAILEQHGIPNVRSL